MGKSRANISQIQKYLNGELDAKAMHQLEREAQDDPFLMDALEGYQMTAGNQQPNLAILSEQLNARVNPKVRRMVPWATIAIAAGVVGFMVVVGLLYKSNEAVKPQQTAQVTQQPTPLADTIATPAVVQAKKNDVAVLQPAGKQAVNSGWASYRKPRSGKMAAQYDKNVPVLPEPKPESEIAVAPVVEREGIPMDEMVIGAITKQKDSVEMPVTVAIAKRPISQPLTGKVAGLVTSSPKNPASQYDLQKLNLPPGYIAGLTNTNVPPPNMAGKIVMPATPSGNYSGYLAAPATAEPAYKNYETLPGVIGANSASNSLGLNAGFNLSSDSGAVVFGRASGLNTLALAHPQKGWVMYQLYLAQKCTLPVGQKTGVVEVKFTVSPAGDIDKITVIKGLSPMANKKAVQLIADGPKWVGNTNGKPEEKTLQLEFIIK